MVPIESPYAMFNALVLGDLCEYRHKSYTAKNFLWTTFLSRTVLV